MTGEMRVLLPLRPELLQEIEGLRERWGTTRLDTVRRLLWLGIERTQSPPNGQACSDDDLVMSRGEANFVATASSRDDAVDWLLQRPGIRRQLQERADAGGRASWRPVDSAKELELAGLSVPSDSHAAAERLLVWRAALGIHRQWQASVAADRRRAELIRWGLGRGMTRGEAIAAAVETQRSERMAAPPDIP